MGMLSSASRRASRVDCMGVVEGVDPCVDRLGGAGQGRH